MKGGHPFFPFWVAAFNFPNTDVVSRTDLGANNFALYDLAMMSVNIMYNHLNTSIFCLLRRDIFVNHISCDSQSGHALSLSFFGDSDSNQGGRKEEIGL